MPRVIEAETRTRGRQICVWDDSDPCIMFPTLNFDLIVDCFFLVLARAY
jgi:hypothetical protein